MSSQAIVTPAQLTHFAGILEDSMKQMRSKSKQMREATRAAASVWADAKYDAFQKDLDECVTDLEKFVATGQKYADFLREKAALANKYLNRR